MFEEISIQGVIGFYYMKGTEMIRRYLEAEKVWKTDRKIRRYMKR